MRDYDEHFAAALGPMRNYINGEAMSFHYRRNQMFPLEQESLRVNKEIRDWFEAEALRGNTWQSSYLDDTTPGAVETTSQQGPTITELPETAVTINYEGDEMPEDEMETTWQGDQTIAQSSSSRSPTTRSPTTRLSSRKMASLLLRTNVIKSHTKASSVKHLKAKL